MRERATIDRLLTVEDAMELTQLSRKRILKAVRQGELIGARFGNRLRFQPSALAAWVERAQGVKR